MFVSHCFENVFSSSALQQEVDETEAQEDLALHLPPCYADADTPDDVYQFDDRILHVHVLVRKYTVEQELEVKDQTI